MRFYYLLPLIFFTGCATVTAPVKHSLAEPPSVLTERCPDLKMIADKEEKLSELLKVIVHNYTLYHECGARHELLVKWYNEQKQIHDATFNKK